MKQIPAPLWTLTIGVVVTLISLWVGFNNHLLPEQASAQSVLVDNFFNVMVVIGTALFFGGRRHHCVLHGAVSSPRGG